MTQQQQQLSSADSTHHRIPTGHRVTGVQHSTSRPDIETLATTWRPAVFLAFFLPPARPGHLKETMRLSEVSVRVCVFHSPIINRMAYLYSDPLLSPISQHSVKTHSFSQLGYPLKRAW